MAQTDFCSLAFRVDEEECVSLVDHPSLSRSGSSTKLEALTNDPAPYVPKNFIKPEVYKMITDWMKDREGKADIFGKIRMDMDIVASDHSTAPPKRFYLTSWRSVARRALERAESQ